MSSSRIVNAGWVPDAVGIPIFRAFGDMDDPLRLTVLIADCLAHESRQLREDAEACKQPGTTWAERLYHLKRILQRVPRASMRRYVGAIVDFDALHTRRPKGAKLWRDRDLRRQRREFFDCLCNAIDAGGWLVLRPNVTDEVSAELPDGLVRASVNIAPIAKKGIDCSIRKISSDVRPVLSWLVEERKVLDVEDVEEISREGTAKLETYILMLAYELLKPSVRAAGRRLSVLRGPQERNGSMGGFVVLPVDPAANTDESWQMADAADRLGALGVVSSAIDTLQACGFIQHVQSSEDGAFIHIPRRIRTFLRRLARIESPTAWSSDNGRLARDVLEQGEPYFQKLPLAAQLEVHQYAIQSDDVEMAKRTAKYYGTDLREIAYRLSREGRFADAANVYRAIVEQFDASDAYAWEYFGFNLAREADRRSSQGGTELTDDQRQQIREAYCRAVAEEKTDNPLYSGRLLGFRAQCGEYVNVEFDERMFSYQNSRWKDTARGYFARTVFDGLIRGGRHGERDELFNLWRRELQGNRFFEAVHDE